VVSATDVTAFFPGAMEPVIVDSVVLKKEVFFKYVVGGDYNFANGMYLNLQYLHGFINERGRDNLNDYFFLQYEMKFFEDRLKLTPLAGGFIVSDWNDVPNNHTIIYAPEILYMPTDNVEITVSPVIFAGKGDDIFAKFVDYDLLMLKLKYSF
jgi:hypothetical protein